MIEISPPAPLETDHDRNFICYVVGYVLYMFRDYRIHMRVLLFEFKSKAETYLPPHTAHSFDHLYSVLYAHVQHLATPHFDTTSLLPF